MSDYSAREIARYLAPSAPVSVIPLAVDYRHPALRVVEPAPVSPGRPTRVLYVGAILQRRHVPLLIAAVARARRQVPDLTLDVIGPNRTHPYEDLRAIARALDVEAAVRLREYVDDTELAEAYRTNGTFAYLSSYEGFGLPPLEAMQAGLATLVMDTPVSREVYRDGAVLVPAGDVDQLAARMVALAADGPARQALVQRGRAVAASYTWARTAERTWNELVEAAGAQR